MTTIELFSVNISDRRSVGTQIKSGFRLAGWLLFTLVCLFLLLGSIASIAGKGHYTRPVERFVAAFVMVALVGVMVATVKHWAKWFIGFLCYTEIKLVISLFFGATTSYPSIAAPRPRIAEYLLILSSATVLSLRYVNHKPTKLDAIGLVALAVGICCFLVLDSGAAILAGTAVLGAVQLTHLPLVRRRLNLT
jgi:hypothetical protein